MCECVCLGVGEVLEDPERAWNCPGAVRGAQSSAGAAHTLTLNHHLPRLQFPKPRRVESSCSAVTGWLLSDIRDLSEFHDWYTGWIAVPPVKSQKLAESVGFVERNVESPEKKRAKTVSSV